MADPEGVVALTLAEDSLLHLESVSPPPEEDLEETQKVVAVEAAVVAAELQRIVHPQHQVGWKMEAEAAVEEEEEASHRYYSVRSLAA